MKKILSATLVAFGLASCAMAPAVADSMTRQERIDILSESVAYLQAEGRLICSVSKLDNRRFLTARHCVMGWPKADYRVVFERKNPVHAEEFINDVYDFERVSSIHMGGGVNSRKSEDDWAVLYTRKDLDRMRKLPLDCTSKIKVGMNVATMGYPAPMGRFYTEGYVASVEATEIERWVASDFWMDLNVSGGNSGGPVINDSGKQIGILIEGLQGSMGGVLAAGSQAISTNDLCNVYGQN